VTVWLSPGGPPGIWEHTHHDPFPAKLIVDDLASLGVSDILFFEQEGRGGPFLHPTTVPHAKSWSQLKDRDYLRELLEQTAPHHINVWLAWTPPSGKYPGTDFAGLNAPELLKIYTDEIEEVARNYRQHRNLAGIMWHEVDCTEAVDSHADDVVDFAGFCRTRFGETYTGAAMPATDPQDKWWRRFFLYRNHVVNEFVRQTGAVARRHGFRISFCSYAPEAFTGEPWKWGYDVVALEKLCERQWFSGYTVESGKPYQRARGACVDFGPSYQGQILARNYSYAMHGAPLSFFEYRAPVYLDEMRRFYSERAKAFNAKYGDFYTGFMGLQPKELELFYGKENLGRWLELMTRWQGGASPARVAVAVHPNAFVMKHPLATGSYYRQQVCSLMAALTTSTDVDGLLLESQFALQPKNLRSYSLIIIPEDMGSGLSQAMVQSLKRYVDDGGKLLVIATPLTTAKSDLMEERDLTREICGLEIAGPGVAGYVTSPDGTKFWSGKVVPIRVDGAEVVCTQGSRTEPLLLRKKGVYFSTAGCSTEGASLFVETLPRLTQPPIRLDANGGIRILESVIKDGLLCVSLWGNGRARLHLDSRALGLGVADLHVREVVAGALDGDFTAAQLAGGIPIEIPHTYQPFICVIGRKQLCERFQPIYSSPSVFAGMREKESLSEPEVPREALGETAAPASSPVAVGRTPRNREIAVVDYARKYQTTTRAAADSFANYCKAVRKAGLTPETVDVDIFLPSQRAERNRYKRIVIPASTDWFSKPMYEGMGEFVRDGGLLITGSGLLLLDVNDNYHAAGAAVFAELPMRSFLGVRANASASTRRLKVLQPCPVTAGLPLGEWIELAPPTSGRQTRNESAEVLVMSDRTQRDRTDGEQPFLTCKHSGRGACIYLVGHVGPEPDKMLERLIANICSQATLEWLCAP